MRARLQFSFNHHVRILYKALVVEILQSASTIESLVLLGGFSIASDVSAEIVSRDVVSTSHVKQNHTDSSLSVDSFLDHHTIPTFYQYHVPLLSTSLDLLEKSAGPELDLVVDPCTSNHSPAR